MANKQRSLPTTFTSDYRPPRKRRKGMTVSQTFSDNIVKGCREKHRVIEKKNKREPLTIDGAPPAETHDRANAYVEQLLVDLREHWPGSSLVPLESWSRSFLGFDYSFSLDTQLFNGPIAGAAAVHRIGASELTVAGGKMTVETTLGLRRLVIQFTASVKFWTIDQTLVVSANLDHLEIPLKFTFNTYTGKDAEIDNFAINSPEQLRIRITGIVPFWGPVSTFLSHLTTYCRRDFHIVLQSLVKYYLGRGISNYTFKTRRPNLRYHKDPKQGRLSSIDEDEASELSE